MYDVDGSRSNIQEMLLLRVGGNRMLHIQGILGCVLVEYSAIGVSPCIIGDRPRSHSAAMCVSDVVLSAKTGRGVQKNKYAPVNDRKLRTIRQGGVAERDVPVRVRRRMLF